jgi:PAT family beta-lactamase induction signal transducer AmpG
MINKPDTHKTAHPIVFLFLFIPFGMVTGYLTVALGFVYSKAGISAGMIAALVANLFIPQIFKFLWAPIVDVTWAVKKWYVLSAFFTALALFATGLLPIKASSWPMLTLLIVLASMAATFLGAAGNNLSAHNTPGEKKGLVSGYIQAGNVGGGTVGGGVGLWLAQRLPAPWMVSGIIALICMLCCLALFFVTEVKTDLKRESALKTVNYVLQDVWLTIKNKLGVMALLLCLLPLGTAAASNIFSAMAGDWKASGDVVALVVGVVGGFASIIGCLVGGWVCDKMNRQVAFVLMGLLQAGCCLGLAFFPHQQNSYVVWILLYSVTNGLCYASYNAFTLEAIGLGAAATKFELYAGVSNTPIYMMTAIAGIAYTKWGANGMLITEAVCAAIAAVLFVLMQALIKRTKLRDTNIVTAI